MVKGDKERKRNRNSECTCTAFKDDTELGNKY